MSVIIIAGGTGRSAIRRFELAAGAGDIEATLSYPNTIEINRRLQALMDYAEEIGCPCDDGNWPPGP